MAMVLDDSRVEQNRIFGVFAGQFELPKLEFAQRAVGVQYYKDRRRR
jgi:hypothetical protein